MVDGNLYKSFKEAYLNGSSTKSNIHAAWCFGLLTKEQYENIIKEKEDIDKNKKRKSKLKEVV